jgi:hypothetical protein
MPPTPAPGSMARGWSVTGQEEQVGLDQAGKPVRGMLVRFQTGKGVAGSVFIPLADYNVANAKAAIAGAAGEIDAVHGLTG